MIIVLVALLFISTAFIGANAVEIYEGTCGINDAICTLNYSSELKPWIHDVYVRMVDSRRVAENHDFISSITNGSVSRATLLAYFKGMYWHVARSGHLFVNLASQRPADVSAFIASIGGRINDGHSSNEAKQATADSFRALITALDGDFDEFLSSLEVYIPPSEWFLHNAQLRAAIYSKDFPWQISVAAMNAGTEGVVPWYCGPLATALETGYGITGIAIEWLRVRGTEEAKRHGDNGFKILSKFVSEDDSKMITECTLYIDHLSLSMSQKLLDCGSRLAKSEMSI